MFLLSPVKQGDVQGEGNQTVGVGRIVDARELGVGSGQPEGEIEGGLELILGTATMRSCMAL